MASVISIFISAVSNTLTVLNIIIGIVMFIIGIFLARVIGDK